MVHWDKESSAVGDRGQEGRERGSENVRETRTAPPTCEYAAAPSRRATAIVRRCVIVLVGDPVRSTSNWSIDKAKFASDRAVGPFWVHVAFVKLERSKIRFGSAPSRLQSSKPSFCDTFCIGEIIAPHHKWQLANSNFYQFANPFD